MPLEGRSFPAGAYLPDRYRVFKPADRGDLLAIRAEGHGANRLGLPWERTDFTAGGDIPDLQRHVASEGDRLPISAEGHAVHHPGVAFQRMDLPVSGCIEKHHHP